MQPVFNIPDNPSTRLSWQKFYKFSNYSPIHTQISHLLSTFTLTFSPVRVLRRLQGPQKMMTYRSSTVNMVDCGNLRCFQERRLIKKELMSWSKKIPLAVGMCCFRSILLFLWVNLICQCLNFMDISYRFCQNYWPINFGYCCALLTIFSTFLLSIY